MTFDLSLNLACSIEALSHVRVYFGAVVEKLEEWKKAVQARGLGASRPLPPALERPWGVTLHAMMCLLGPPEVDPNGSVALLEELDALDDIATPDRQKL
jgi:hypothetical protein